MRKLPLLAFIFTGFLSSATFAAADVKSYHQTFQKDAAEAAQSGDVAGYTARSLSACQALDGSSGEATIDDRLKAAKQRRMCLEAAQSDGVASFLKEGKPLIVDQSFKSLLAEAEAEERNVKSQVDFMGLSWGLGFGYSFATSGKRIDAASIVNGVVRAESSNKDQPRAILEFHKYFWCNKGRTIGTRGCGPFVGVAATQDDVLSGVAMGLMYGMKIRESDPDGFSIGVGAILDDDVKDLGSGFKNGEAPPAGETAVRFRSKARWSGLVFVTRTF